MTDTTSAITPSYSALRPSADGLISVDQALTYVLERARPMAGEQTIGIEQALGRVLAEPVSSPIDVPGYDNSAMDGYAVRSADLVADGRVCLVVSQRVAAGQLGQPLAPGQAARIFTGAPLPPGADAVVIQENCVVEGANVLMDGPVEPGTWVRPRGNDIRLGAQILDAGVRLRPQEIGLLASVGHASVRVRPKPRVAVFSSGDELLAPGETLRPGTIYNSNRYILRALVEGLGCDYLDLGTVEDTLAATRTALLAAADVADVVVTSGGMSVGEEDHLKAALEEVGQLEMWKVAVKPGKPLAYGRIGNADFLGLPGNPVSALVTFCLFVRPFLLSRLGIREAVPAFLPVTANFDWPKPVRRREFVRARAQWEQGAGATGRLEVSLFPRQGSDVLTSTVWASGLVEIREGETYRRGDAVRYLPFTELLG